MDTYVFHSVPRALAVAILVVLYSTGSSHTHRICCQEVTVTGFVDDKDPNLILSRDFIPVSPYILVNGAGTYAQ